MSLKIEPILCNAGFMDNYTYLITDVDSGLSALVDASESRAIIDKCEKENVKPQYIFLTHHHEDHTNACEDLKQKYGLQVVGSAEERPLVKMLDISLNDGDTFSLGESRAQIILTKGHTNGHILWYFPDDKTLFTGDMLFNLNIGGLFEGTPEQMWNSIQKIKYLPDDTRFYPGHEYTLSAITFLQSHLDNPQYQQYMEFVENKVQNKQPIVGQILGLEKKCNPYFQPDLEEFSDYFER